MKLICKIFGHKPSWKKEYQVVYYDPDSTHNLICERCNSHLNPITFKDYTPSYIGKIW